MFFLWLLFFFLCGSSLSCGYSPFIFALRCVDWNVLSFTQSKNNSSAVIVRSFCFEGSLYKAKSANRLS